MTRDKLELLAIAAACIVAVWDLLIVVRQLS